MAPVSQPDEKPTSEPRGVMDTLRTASDRVPSDSGKEGTASGPQPSFLRVRSASRPSRHALPSLVPDDEEPEDTLANALAPLVDAELGRASLAPDTVANLAPTLVTGEVPLAEIVEALADEDTSEAMPTGLPECLAHIGVAVIETDAADNVLAMNAFAERLTGWPSVEASGAPLGEILRLREPEPPEAALAAALGASPPEHNALLERRDGQLLPIRHVRGLAHPEVDGRAGRLVVFRDVSGQQFLALQLARQARHDSLTGLLNRHGLADRIDQALADSRARGVRHVLCYFDLDRFRIVNASCGHDAGDDLLQWVATRLYELVGPSDCAGRIGGDEFAILLVGKDAREGERVARDLQRRLGEFRFGFEDKTFAVGASFGVVPFGAEAGRSGEVLGAADHACRLAKDAGRGRIQVYLSGDDQMAESRRSIQWVAGLQRNLEEGRLRLFAQGIQPLAIRGEVGAHFEVLVRLVDDQGRFQSPVGIIQAAENSGTMDAIDRFVVKQAMRMIGALPQRAMRRLDTCAINLSGLSLVREGLLDYIVQEMNKASVPPSKVCFEITETAALANLGEVLWLMQELGAMGCRFAIDDFGSGHASYGYLENLPVDYVKIDGLFVRDLTDNALHRAIVESVHRIGSTLGIKTVAESVETQAIADMLMGMGVHYAQGWLYGKPKPLGEVCADLDRD
jgi:diguanylate cyclase (GGDEF)-like protein